MGVCFYIALTYTLTIHIKNLPFAINYTESQY